MMNTVDTDEPNQNKHAFVQNRIWECL